MPLKIFSTPTDPAKTHSLSDTLNLTNPRNNNLSESSEDKESSTTGKSIHIDLSDYGLKKSRNENKNQDIDDSDLPNEIKNSLKAIRELKALLKQKTMELQQLMANKSLSGERRDIKAQQLQMEIASINAALLSTMTTLVDTFKEAGLSPEQTASFAQLLMV